MILDVEGPGTPHHNRQRRSRPRPDNRDELSQREKRPLAIRETAYCPSWNGVLLFLAKLAVKVVMVKMVKIDFGKMFWAHMFATEIGWHCEPSPMLQTAYRQASPILNSKGDVYVMWRWCKGKARMRCFFGFFMTPLYRRNICPFYGGTWQSML